MITRRKTRGICLVEILIALVIAAVLLAATTTALMALVGGVRTNEQYARSRQATRGAMELVLAKVRKAKELTLLDAASGDSFQSLVTLDQGTWNAVTKTYDNPKFTRYYRSTEWDAAAAKNVPVIRVSSTLTNSPSDPVLLRYVDNVVFRSVPDASGDFCYVTVEMTVNWVSSQGGKPVTYALAGTAVARSAL